MTVQNDVDLFRRLSAVQGFEDYLKRQTAAAQKILACAEKELHLRQAQGKVLFIEEMAKQLEHAKSLR